MMSACIWVLNLTIHHPPSLQSISDGTQIELDRFRSKHIWHNSVLLSIQSFKHSISVRKKQLCWSMLYVLGYTTNRELIICCTLWGLIQIKFFRQTNFTILAFKITSTVFTAGNLRMIVIVKASQMWAFQL